MSQSVENLALQVFQSSRPVVITQLNSSDRAARQAAQEAGLPTAGVVPRGGAYSSSLRDRYEVCEAASSSLRQADLANVVFAKNIALAASALRGDVYADRHLASTLHAAHVGVLYGLSYTDQRCSGAATLKSSACLGSPSEAYDKGYDTLPKPDGLEAALQRGAVSFRDGNRLFLLNLRRETVAQAAAALGSFLRDRSLPLYSLVVSGPQASSVPGVQVGDRLHETLTQAFALAYPPKSAAPEAPAPGSTEDPLWEQASEVATALGADSDGVTFVAAVEGRAYYRLADQEDTWFVKLYRSSPETRDTASQERAMTLWAASQGYSPASREVPEPSCAVVTAYLRDSDLTREQVRQPAIRQKVMRLLERVHSSEDLPDGVIKPTVARNFAAGAQGHLERLRKSWPTAVVTVNSLSERTAYLAAALAAAPLVLKPCGGDVHYGNLLRHPETEEIFMIDWSGAHYDDPAYDVARFAYTSRIPNCDVGDLVRAYNQTRAESPLDLTHVRRMIAMINTDYLGYFSDSSSTSPKKEVLERCLDDEKYLADMPKLRRLGKTL